MGWFSRVVSSMTATAIEIGSAVRQATTVAWQATKQAAATAIGWMAENGESFVGTVKEVWKHVRPHVDKLRLVLRTVATATSASYPWLSSVLTVVDTIIGTLTAFENSPVAKWLDEAIKWAIEFSKKMKSSADISASATADEQELKAAQQHQQTFRTAEKSVPEEHRHTMAVLGMISDFAVARGQVKELIRSNEFTNFEHYLRLRATEKLLAAGYKKLASAKDIASITPDDVFIIRVAANLIKPDPELTEDDAQRLDALVAQRFDGKRLAPFVFEEMIIAWGARLEAMQATYASMERRTAQDATELSRLSFAKRIDVERKLNEQDQARLTALEKSVPESEAELKKQAQSEREMRNYIFAAEGFLQVLEKSPEQLEEEDRSYLAEYGGQVGQLIIECSQNGRPWATLSAEEQSLIEDFANVFAEECKKRYAEVRV